MSTYESAYKSLLQGVSQQLPEERLPGQLTAQVNMLSDPVTNLRRRPGAVYKSSFHWAQADTEHTLGWFTDVAGARVHVLLNTNTGDIRVLDENFTQVAQLPGGEYLTTSEARNIRNTSVGSEFFLANTSVIPRVSTEGTRTNPADSGFFYVPSGSYGRNYNVKVTWKDNEYSASYTTPSGTGAGDAALSTPEYIAEQLATQISGQTIQNIRLLSFSSTMRGPSGAPQDPTYVSYDLDGNPTTHNITYSTALEVNTGTDFNPVWTTVSFPYENTRDFFSQGKLRVRVTVGPELFGVYLYFPFHVTSNVTYQVRVASAWQPTVYTSATVSVTGIQGSLSLVPRDFVAAYPVTAFTSGVSMPAPLFSVQREGPYVFVSRSGGISVNTTLGSQYLITSRGGSVPAVGDLPAKLPPAGDGYVCRTGTGDAPVHYRFDYARSEWLEDSEYGSPTSIQQVPVSLTRDENGDWIVNTEVFEGRLAGDDKTNATHAFARDGITGMATYQGRLVLMSGPMVSLSASNKPRRFYRSTVTNVIPSDTIEIGSGMNSSAKYEWGLPFQKDLLLFSRSYQALIPAGNTALTPSNATVVPTSSHEGDTTSSPIALGRTVMYAKPRSEDFFGVLEMLPSNFTDSQYVSQDSTPHLPKYMGGRCRFAVASGVSSMALFGPSGDVNSLIVHEYHWDGDTKVQQSWHQWTFEYPIATAYFASDQIVLVFIQNERAVLATLDPRAGALNLAGERRPLLDLNFPLTIANNLIVLPDWLVEFDPDAASKVRAIARNGALAGELVGTSTTPDPTTLSTVLSWPEGDISLGLPYRSTVIPSPPLVTDYNNEVIHSGKATLVRYLVGTRNSSEFEVMVTDRYTAEEDLDVPTLNWSSPELELERGLFSEQDMAVVPCRTDMRSTAMEVSTNDAGELNITALEYVGRYHPKVKRK